MNIPCPHGQHQIAGFRETHDLLDGFLERSAVANIRTVDRLNQRKRIDAGDRSFAGSINIDHANNIRRLKTISKFMQQIASAGVAMRLKKNKNALEAALTGRFQRGANFCGVMAVIIDHGDAADFPFALKPALDATKIRKPTGDVFNRDAELDPNGNGG